ncbi:hypothetical protein HWV62_11501 [Athelia sp. TMB]|nr:hypothetical protein HWV62_11501 [Athelia sp. TMB]
MFSLPQVPVANAEKSKEKADGLPVVHLSETSSTLKLLLSMCYPMTAVDQPALDNFEEVALLLDAVIKYDIEKAEKRVREALVSPQCLQGNALRVFAIAYRHKLELEVRKAATESLRGVISRGNRGLEQNLLSAAKLLDLLEYHDKCVTAAREAVSTTAPSSWPGMSVALKANQWCPHCQSKRGFRAESSASGEFISTTFMSRLPNEEEIQVALEERQWPAFFCSGCGRGQIPSPTLAHQFVKSMFHKIAEATASIPLNLDL